MISDTNIDEAVFPDEQLRDVQAAQSLPRIWTPGKPLKKASSDRLTFGLVSLPSALTGAGGVDATKAVRVIERAGNNERKRIFLLNVGAATGSCWLLNSPNISAVNVGIGNLIPQGFVLPSVASGNGLNLTTCDELWAIWVGTLTTSVIGLAYYIESYHSTPTARGC